MRPTRSQTKTSTPASSRRSSENMIKQTSSHQDSASKTGPAFDIQTLTQEIRQFREEMTALKQQLTNAVTAISSCNERLDDITTRLSQSDDRIKFLEERIGEQESTIFALKEQLNYHAQSQLLNEVEMIGFPEHKNENLSHIVLTTASKVGVSLCDADLDDVKRAGVRRPSKTTAHHKQPPRPIVVRFTRKHKRDEFIKAAKSRRDLNTRDIDPTELESKIYVNDRLTHENRQLFRAARTRAKEMDFKHCWTSGGNIFVRKGEGTGPIQIRRSSDLDRYLDDQSSSHKQAK